MTLKRHVVLIGLMAIVLSSCGQPTSPAMIYANTASTLIKVEEGVDQEAEYDAMIEGGQLRLQQPYFMDTMPSSVFQNELVEIRELLDIIREAQRFQNHQRLLIMMESSMIKALATSIQDNQIVIEDNVALTIVTAQEELIQIKSTVNALRQEKLSLVRELRTWMRSINRPVSWNETLIQEVKDLLASILEVTESLATNLTVALPLLESTRALLLNIIPVDLVPLNDAINTAYTLFKNQLANLDVLQTAIQSVRQDINISVQDIKAIIQALKENNQELPNGTKAALTIHRLAVAQMMQTLRSLQQQNHNSFETLRGKIHFQNLDLINTVMTQLITNAEQRLSLLTDILEIFGEAKLILES